MGLLWYKESRSPLQWAEVSRSWRKKFVWLNRPLRPLKYEFEHEEVALWTSYKQKSIKELLKTLKHETRFIKPALNIPVETQGENSKDTLIDSAKAIRIIYEWDVLKTRPSIVRRKNDENPSLVRKIFSLYNRS